MHSSLLARPTRRLATPARVTTPGRLATPARIAGACFVLLLAACGPGAGAGNGSGGNGSGNGNGTGNGTGNGNGESTDDPMLIEGAFTIEPFSEHYQCVRLTIEEDLWITKITPIAPPGTHHTLLAIDGGSAPDGVTTCGPFSPSWTPLFASGLGSPALNMPEGVALKIPAGETLLLNLHLFNVGEEPIEGVSGLQVQLADPEDVEYEAGVVLAGPSDFTIPEGPEETISGQCTLNQDTNFFALFPHMHQYGRSMTVRAEDEVVYDGPFDFEHQDFLEFEPIPMAQGERIRVECIYENLTGAPIRFGDSSEEEMCFAISYLYPWTGFGFTGFCSF